MEREPAGTQRARAALFWLLRHSAHQLPAPESFDRSMRSRGEDTRLTGPSQTSTILYTYKDPVAQLTTADERLQERAYGALVIVFLDRALQHTMLASPLGAHPSQVYERLVCGLERRADIQGDVVIVRCLTCVSFLIAEHTEPVVRLWAREIAQHRRFQVHAHLNVCLSVRAPTLPDGGGPRPTRRARTLCAE
jgi:hypothetical protein